MENIRRCEICNVDFHRASMQKQLRSAKQLEIEKQNEMILPEWLFKEEQALIRNKTRKVYSPKTLQQIARENFNTNDKVLEEDIAKKLLIHVFLLMKF